MEWSKPTDGIVSRYINRKISGLITSFIIRKELGITPTHISLLSFLLGLSASVLYVLGGIVLAGFILQLSSILDGVDGELARARGLTSKLGEFIDTMLDRGVNILAYISITYYLYSVSPDIYIVLLGLLSLSGDMLVTYFHAVVKKDFNVHPASVGSFPPLASRDVRIFILFLASLGALLYIELLIYGLALIFLISYLYLVIKGFEVVRSIKSGLI